MVNASERTCKNGDAGLCYVYFTTVREIGGKISGKCLVLYFYFLNYKPLENHFLKEFIFLRGAEKIEEVFFVFSFFVYHVPLRPPWKVDER